ncbi:PAS domain-containing protein, partial [Fodinicurvata halophila]
MVYTPSIQNNQMVWKGSRQVEDLTDAVAREMSADQWMTLTYWYRMLPAEGLPARNRFDPLEVWSAVARIVLFEIVGQGEDVIFRLVGEDFEMRAGSGLRGQRFSEIGNPAQVPPTLAIVEEMYRDGRPILSAGSLATLDRGYVGYRRLAMPFAEEDGGPAR